MFKFFHKDKSETIVAPIAGEVIELSAVADPVFSQKMMGEGFGIHPSNGTIYAPVSGKVTLVADTKHGIGITTDDGLEVLVHLGIDTVELKGAPFSIKIAVNDQVTAGQEIGTMDLAAIKDAGKDPTVMVVITNSKDLVEKVTVETGNKSGGDPAAKVTKK